MILSYSLVGNLNGVFDRVITFHGGKEDAVRGFIDSLDRDACPDDLGPCLQALWYDAKGGWDTAHEIVQQLDDVMAARIHAYLHRKEGDDWNSRYWHRRAGSVFPQGMSLEEEWDSLVQAQLE